MSHLSPSEFVDLVDGALAPARAAHLERCEACREQASAIRRAVESAESVDVPEPSPLFWDHLSARVRAEIDDAPVARTPWWRRSTAMLAWATAAMLIVAVAIRQAPRRAEPPADAPLAAAETAPERPDAPDPAWDLLVSAAGDLQIEEAHAVGFGVRAATLDSAVLELTPAEREELGRLLRAELKHSGA